MSLRWPLGSPVLSVIAVYALTLWACAGADDDSSVSHGGRGGETTHPGAGTHSGGGGQGGASGGALSCEAEPPKLLLTWQALKTSGGPSARSLHAATAIADGVLLLGGADQVTVLADTWSLSGSDWQLLEPGPTARAAHAMVTTSDSAFLFGGLGVDGPLADTWAWKDAWKELCPAGACTRAPSARASHRMAFDPASKRVLLFGGSDGLPLGDSWEWSDGNGWQQTCESATNRVAGEGGAAGAGFAPCAPPARDDHAMAYDPISQRVLMFGGHDGRTELGDLWAYEHSTWIEVNEFSGDASPAVSGHVMAYDPGAKVMLVTGGLRSDVEANASYGLLTESMTWLKAREIGEVPSQRAHGSLTYDESAQRLVFYDEGAWTVSSRLIPTADYCSCLASCEAVCEDSESLCKDRCQRGMDEPPAPSDCSSNAGAGGSSETGEGGSSGASTEPTRPNDATCQSLWSCCDTIHDVDACKRTAAADDSKICNEAQPLCKALQSGGIEGAKCLALGACCAKLKGSLLSICFDILSGRDADCAEFLASGYCEAN
ncbi:MAG TPA: kelch repeat-containing protein [Polyangiaceae bacterium]|nr:kelch repeat-containing protein [Polyangiaceae bacterium]